MHGNVLASSEYIMSGNGSIGPANSAAPRLAASLDHYLGIHPAALKVRAQRTELLANNLANADTPNFKARDIDFRQVLAKTNGSTAAPLTATRPGHISLATAGAEGNPDLKYRTPLAPSLDGNTVDAQLEQSAFAENAVRYQASLTFLGAKFRSLLTAITGQ
jgi:flagellar basal-body rod protein FlgB